MYRYYFSNKHLPILFFFPLTPLFVVTKINVLSTINHLGNEKYRMLNIEKRVRPIRNHLLENFLTRKETKKESRAAPSLTQFSNMTNTPFYSIRIKKKKKKRQHRKSFPKKKERSSIDPLEPLTNEPLSQSTTLLACFRSPPLSKNKLYNPRSF